MPPGGGRTRRRAGSELVGRIWITVDVEAQRGRAADRHVERLVWGREGYEEFGIGRMMDVADFCGVPLTMFIDLAEIDVYGPEMAEVPRNVHRRGHDAQLHVHSNFFSPRFWDEAGVPGITDLNRLDGDQADAIAAELVRRHETLVGTPALAFRGGGYRFCPALLEALFRRGVILDSTANRGRLTQPMITPEVSPFLWSWGTVECPIAVVAPWPGRTMGLEFNFNSTYFGAGADALEFLRVYFDSLGPNAVAVLVMHSWSFLDRSAQHFGPGRPDQVRKFEEILRGASDAHEFVSSPDIVTLLRSGCLEMEHVVVPPEGTSDEVQRATVGPAEGSAAYTLLREALDHAVPGSPARNGAGEPVADASARTPGPRPPSEVNATIDGGSTSVLSGIIKAAGALSVASCPWCGEALTAAHQPGCLESSSRPRTRSLGPVIQGILRPLLAKSDLREQPLLGFAMTRAEEALLSELFQSISSVSLFGKYAANHEEGVDVRDLGRYPVGAFAGVFGCLLFDYVPQLGQAFMEAFRVLAPGGVLFTHIAPYRLLDGVQPPVVKSTIVPRAGYFEYVPAEGGLPSIEVGREWIVSAMTRVGFESHWLVVEDTLSGERLDWFIGLKPGLDGPGDAAAHAASADGETAQAPAERSAGAP
jgi:hypothetical protein